MENKKEIKLSKSIVYSIIITALVVLALSAFIFYYMPKIKHTSEVKNYKKEMFNSVLCQYSCPLSEQTNNNKTQLLPEKSCIQTCTQNFQTLQKSGLGISDNDLLSDNLIQDIQLIVKACQTSSIITVNQLPQVNNTAFFPCVSQGLMPLKENYTYLN